MNLLYNFFAHFAYFLLKFYGLFHKKMKLFIQGRKKTFQKLSVIKKEDKVIWFHTASLGEFEQAIPIIEKVKQNYSSYKIVVTFFSPSGYEIRKNYELADAICYLPFDTKDKVKKFVEIVHPEIAIIVKYEFWPNLLNELKRQSITTILVSGILRENQIFFKFYGGFMRKSLKAFHHFFLQNQSSVKLLNSIGFNNATLSGDTRFDRVSRILEQDNSLNFIEQFKNNSRIIVAGSTWQEDEQLLVNYINNSTEEKFIIAPHNIDKKAIEKLKLSLTKKVILFTEINQCKDSKTYDVFIIDTIGLLTKIYSYADVAYIGGGFKTGLHNILEPATFGIPIVIGPNYNKFQEAIDLTHLNGCFSVSNLQEFTTIFNQLKENQKLSMNAGKINHHYVQKNKGATEIIMKYIHQKLIN